MMNTQHIDALSLTYNTDRTPLKLSEYGRHIQSMVDHVLTMEDRAMRTHAAHAVVDAIAQLQPSIKEFPDWQHKLWDHVFSLSDYTLDVDAPFPAPLPEGRAAKGGVVVDIATGGANLANHVVGEGIELE
jgi:hypothetical protein